MVRIGLNDIYSFNKTHVPTGFDSTIQHLEKTSLQGIRGSTVQINRFTDEAVVEGGVL